MQRLMVLMRLQSRRLLELLGMRAARMYAVGVALTFAVLMLLSRDGASAGSMDALLARALVSMSWAVAGLSALSAARDLKARDHSEGVTALVALRGHDVRLLELARFAAAATRIAFWVFVPASALVLLASLVLANAALLPWSLAWLAFLAVYSVALGASLGGLARAAAALSPRRGRSLLLLIVLAPALVRGVWPAAPSIPHAFGWAIDRAANVDGAVG